MTRFSPPGPLGFGGAPLGNMFDVVDEETAEAALVAAWDSGVRYFDTAPHYGSGLSEHRFGTVLRRYPREAFVLSTKVGRLLRPDPSRPDNPPFVRACRSGSRPTTPMTRRCGRLRTAASASAWRRSTLLSSMISPPTTLGRRGKTRSRSHGPVPFARLRNCATRARSKAGVLGVNLTEPCIRALEQADPDRLPARGALQPAKPAGA